MGGSIKRVSLAKKLSASKDEDLDRGCEKWSVEGVSTREEQQIGTDTFVHVISHLSLWWYSNHAVLWIGENNLSTHLWSKMEREAAVVDWNIQTDYRVSQLILHTFKLLWSPKFLNNFQKMFNVK